MKISKITAKILTLFCCVFIINMTKVVAAPNIERFGGKDRYETSIKISRKNWITSDNVILVSGENFPDALSASPLSTKYNAPILLSNTNNIGKDTLQEIKRLKAKNVIIIGGIGVISKNIDNTLKLNGINCTRIFGKDRYETNFKIAKVIGLNNGAFIVSGENFPDAISVGPIAGSMSMPIILASSSKIYNDTKNLIYENSTKKYYIIGGNSCIKDDTVKNIKNYKRLGGKDRYDTNKIIIDEFKYGMDFTNTYIASGLAFPDALSGSTIAAKNSSPIVLVNKLYGKANSIIKCNLSDITTLGVLGGEGVISNALIKKIVNSKIKVCLDAGHGGYDSGAIGSSGILEKDVTLAITLKTGKILEQNGIEVIYTRTSDKVSWPSKEILDLQKRCDIANDANVSYFIAIHANSADISKANGTEVYYSPGSEKGQKLAESIQNEIIKATNLYNRGTKTANFYVLNHTEAPAALVETGFISNSKEEKLLNSDDFQQTMAKAISNGVINVVNK